MPRTLALRKFLSDLLRPFLRLATEARSLLYRNAPMYFRAMAPIRELLMFSNDEPCRVIVANSLAGAMTNFPKRAGTPWPLGWVIALAGIGTWVGRVVGSQDLAAKPKWLINIRL
jgi:hypothetical protein